MSLSSKQVAERSAITRALAVIMQTRGSDSTGIASVTKNNIHLRKAAIPARSFIVDSENNHLIDTADTLIGHTRLATHGAITNDNAHPFVVGDIVGAHNGIVYNWRDVNADVAVDSMTIFDSLNKQNNDYEKAFKKLYGQFALSWVDQKSRDNLYLCTSGNPVVWGEAPGLNTVFWASTTIALEQAMAVVLGAFSDKFWTPGEDKVAVLNKNLVVSQVRVAPFMSQQQYVSSFRSSEFPDDKKLSKKQRKRLKKMMERHYAAYGDDNDERQYQNDTQTQLQTDTGLEYCDWCGGNILLDIDGFYYRESCGEFVCIMCGQEESNNDYSMVYHAPQIDSNRS